jgi:hypothetical protein
LFRYLPYVSPTQLNAAQVPLRWCSMRLGRHYANSTNRAICGHSEVRPHSKRTLPDGSACPTGGAGWRSGAAPLTPVGGPWATSLGVECAPGRPRRCRDDEPRDRGARRLRRSPEEVLAVCVLALYGDLTDHGCRVPSVNECTTAFAGTEDLFSRECQQGVSPRFASLEGDLVHMPLNESHSASQRES